MLYWMLDLLITSLWFIGTSNLTMDHVPRGMGCYKVITVITKKYIVFMVTYILSPSCFYVIWALCVLWITYNYLYYNPCFAGWALFGLLVPAKCNCISCVQVHELPATNPLWWYLGGQIAFIITFILCPSCLCKIWAFWVVDHLKLLILCPLVC